jgi:hypothetical protein
VPNRLMNFLENTLWPKAEEPIVEILIHLAVTVLSVLSIAFIELLLYVMRLDGKEIPGTALLFRWLGLDTTATLSDWMLLLEIFAASAIIIVGIVKAIVVLVRS